MMGTISLLTKPPLVPSGGYFNHLNRRFLQHFENKREWAEFMKKPRTGRLVGAVQQIDFEKIADKHSAARGYPYFKQRKKYYPQIIDSYRVGVSQGSPLSISNYGKPKRSSLLNSTILSKVERQYKASNSNRVSNIQDYALQFAQNRIGLNIGEKILLQYSCDMVEAKSKIKDHIQRLNINIEAEYQCVEGRDRLSLYDASSEQCIIPHPLSTDSKIKHIDRIINVISKTFG